MALSRKRQRELKRLKRSADELWEQQREALDHANQLLRDARRQASALAREEVAPRINDVYTDRVQPAVATGIAGARAAGGIVKDRVVGDVLPALSGVVGSAMAVLEAVRDPRVREVVRSAARGKTVVVPAARRGPGPGAYILIGLGVVAVAGVAYAAWQTLRADEDLWIEDLADVGAIDVGEDDDEF